MTLLKQIIIGIIVVSGISVVYAATWSGPTQSPPGGNVPTPLNIGPDDQVKTGGLIPKSLFVSGGPMIINDGTEGTVAGKILTSIIKTVKDASGKDVQVYGVTAWKTPMELGLGAGGGSDTCVSAAYTKTVLGVPQTFPSQIVMKNYGGHFSTWILNVWRHSVPSYPYGGELIEYEFGGRYVSYKMDGTCYGADGMAGSGCGTTQPAKLALDGRFVDDGTDATKNSKCVEGTSIPLVSGDSSSPVVAFSSNIGYIRFTGTSQMQPGSAVYNYGNGYNGSEFTAPVAGVYHFDGQADVYSGTQNQSALFLKKNSSVIGGTSFGYHQAGTIIQLETSADVLLGKGDKVTLNAQLNSDGAVNKARFNGHLISGGGSVAGSQGSSSGDLPLAAKKALGLENWPSYIVAGYPTQGKYPDSSIKCTEILRLTKGNSNSNPNSENVLYTGEGQTVVYFKRTDGSYNYSSVGSHTNGLYFWGPGVYNPSITVGKGVLIDGSQTDVQIGCTSR